MMTTPANPASSILSDADWQRLSRQTQYYVVSGFELMDKSDDYLRDDDLRQASEKGWGAAAQIIKAVAENWRAHGARHRSHWHLTALVKGLAALDPASQVESAFRDVQALHENFYENNLARSAVSSHLTQVISFVNAMQVWLSQPVPPQDVRQYYRRRRTIPRQ